MWCSIWLIFVIENLDGSVYIPLMAIRFFFYNENESYSVWNYTIWTTFFLWFCKNTIRFYIRLVVNYVGKEYAFIAESTNAISGTIEFLQTNVRVTRCRDGVAKNVFLILPYSFYYYVCMRFKCKKVSIATPHINAKVYCIIWGSSLIWVFCFICCNKIQSLQFQLVDFYWL